MLRKILIFNYLNLFVMSKRITRSTVNEQQYSAEAFPKSGFNLTHRRYSSYILGRLQVSGHQDVMPGDKIAGKNDGTFTFNNIVTPMIPKVDVQQYNFLQPHRAVDRSFEKAFAPSKNNNMSASWNAPSISTQTIVRYLIEAYINDATEAFTTLFNDLIREGSTNPRTSNTILADLWDDPVLALYGNTDMPNVTGIVSRLHLMFDNERMTYFATFKKCFKDLYLDDVLADILQRIDSTLGTRINPIDSSTLVRDLLYKFLDCFLTPFVGRYSYYADFHYNYVRPKDLYTLTHGAVLTTYESLISAFDATELNEYPIRHFYSIWYEYFRNVDLEPVSQDLPDWRDFSSGSIVENNPAFLVYRPRPWYADQFISAQIDDLSRHVYAPIISSTGADVAVFGEGTNKLDTQVNARSVNAASYGGHVNPTIYNIGWRDQVTGTDRVISCPVPSNINDILSSTDNTFINVYGLDLTTLRQSQQLERYLKRNYLFGDEYNDRMLAHYNSRVSDLRINRPELVSQSFNSSDNKQEIANMSNGISNAGDRTATATINAGGDDYNVFCEEFGCLIHVISFMPTACYDGIHPQLLLSKMKDYPLPEFATNNEEFGRKIEIASSGLILPNDLINMFGRYPAYHAWRQRVDEVGGMFLDELQDCTFRRFWGLDGQYQLPVLNYHFIHCHPNLQMFRNTIVYDSQIYGDIVHECYVERVLPTPVEKI